MPIMHDIELRSLSRDEFHALDYRFMGFSFDVHREYGRLHNEAVYEQILCDVCLENGISVRRQLPVQVRFGAFKKVYYIDILLEDASVCELKTSTGIDDGHRAQTLHYLMLLGTQWGKIVNMRPFSVQSEFVTTSMAPSDRYDLHVSDASWRDLDGRGSQLKEFVLEMLADLGGFLSVALYAEILGSCLAPAGVSRQPVDIMRRGAAIAAGETLASSPDVGIRFTAMHSDHRRQESHLLRYLKRTSLRGVYWVNLDHHSVEFRTLTA